MVFVKRMSPTSWPKASQQKQWHSEAFTAVISSMVTKKLLSTISNAQWLVEYKSELNTVGLNGMLNVFPIQSTNELVIVSQLLVPALHYMEWDGLI